jgi:Holliday junction DNA helicase RuvA
MGGNLYPRLLGFLNVTDRSFFLEFVKVKGMGMRKALRAMAKPPAWIADVIERGDVKLLATLPEVGKRTADQLVASLKGKLQRFAVLQTLPAGTPLTQAQREALEILLQLGERRAEAAELVARVSVDKALTDPARIVEAVYKLKSGLL